MRASTRFSFLAIQYYRMQSRFSLTWSHSVTLRNALVLLAPLLNSIRVQEHSMAPSDLNASLH